MTIPRRASRSPVVDGEECSRKLPLVGRLDGARGAGVSDARLRCCYFEPQTTSRPKARKHAHSTGWYHTRGKGGKKTGPVSLWFCDVHRRENEVSPDLAQGTSWVRSSIARPASHDHPSSSKIERRKK